MFKWLIALIQFWWLPTSTSHLFIRNNHRYYILWVISTTITSLYRHFNLSSHVVKPCLLGELNVERTLLFAILQDGVYLFSLNILVESLNSEHFVKRCREPHRSISDRPLEGLHYVQGCPHALEILSIDYVHLYSAAHLARPGVKSGNEVGLTNQECFAVACGVLHKDGLTFYWKYLSISLALTLGWPVSWKGFVVPRPALTEVSYKSPSPE